MLPLVIEESSGVGRCNEPVTVGLPFRRGQLSDARLVRLLSPLNEEVTVQAQALSCWADGSVRWLLLDFQANVEANGTTAYRIEYGRSQCSFESGLCVRVRESTRQLEIDTGAAVFLLNKILCKPFDSVRVGEFDVICPERSGLFLRDTGDYSYDACIDEAFVETPGPLRATVCTIGTMRRGKEKPIARFVLRASFFAGRSLAELNLTLHNPNRAHHPGGLWDLGDPGSIFFRDLTLELGFRSEQAPVVNWTEEATESSVQETHESWQIYQDSSGGENWQGANHVDRFNKVVPSFRGYRVSVNGAVAGDGLRALPIATVRDDARSITTAVDKFWQNFPKALEADKSRISIRLFPAQAGNDFELQGGEQKTQTVYLQFADGNARPQDLRWVHDRLLPRAVPDWYAQSGAIGCLSPVECPEKDRAAQLIQTAVAGPRSFFTRREVIDEYGWRNFGEVYADHEAVKSATQTPLISHYNNQYDIIFAALVQYLRSGDRRWFELADDLTRHVIDIDIYHTKEDCPVYNGGMFWHTDHYLDAGTATHRAFSRANVLLQSRSSYGGGPSNEHNYTSGLLLYHFLTGSPAARDAVLELGEWVMNMEDGSMRFLGFLDRRPTGASSSTASRDYHGPGRGAGNSINALLDAYQLSRTKRYLERAEALLRRCIHPLDDIEDRDLGDVEHRWSYLVFLQVLGKYLDLKIAENQSDYMYAYGQASLLHYAGWMLDHEVPYSRVLDRVEIPTETWPAQDIRKSVVLHFAAKHAAEPVRSALRDRAGFFFDQCLEDLSQYATADLARPLTLLMGNAYVHAYFEMNPDEIAPARDPRHEFGAPERFEPQFCELQRMREKAAGCLNHIRLGARLGTFCKRTSLWRLSDG